MAHPTEPPPPAPSAAPSEAPAKPSQPGPKEPENISASILPQRQHDADQHPAPDAAPADQGSDDGRGDGG
jgi:hypothetical protein